MILALASFAFSNSLFADDRFNDLEFVKPKILQCLEQKGTVFAENYKLKRLGSVRLGEIWSDRSEEIPLGVGPNLVRWTLSADLINIHSGKIAYMICDAQFAAQWILWGDELKQTPDFEGQPSDVTERVKISNCAIQDDYYDLNRSSFDALWFYW